MILSRGKTIIQRRTIATTKYSRKINGASQHVTPVCSISSSSSTSSSSLPLSFTVDDRHRHQQRSGALSPFTTTRNFSAATEKKEKSQTSSSSSRDTETTNETETAEEESLKDTVRRMQREKSGGDDATDERVNDFMRQASDFWSTATEEVGQTWNELLRSGERKDINKKIGHPQDTMDGDTEYSGPVSIMVIDESENLTAWERMQKRLTDAPVIQGK
jgi:hypothetical protein